MRYIIFRNPKILHREEKFGGIVKSNNYIFILGKKEYNILKNLNKYIPYSCIDKDKKIIIDKFLELKIFLKIKEKKAKQIINAKLKKLETNKE